MSRRIATTFVSVLALVSVACGENGGPGPAGSEGTTEHGSTSTSTTTHHTDDSSTAAGEPETTGCVLGRGGSEIPPSLDDMPGGPCCTTKEGCTGRNVAGSPAQLSDLGQLLACVEGTWVVHEAPCEEECAERAESTGENIVYAGCFWDSTSGILVSPICGCTRKP